MCLSARNTSVAEWTMHPTKTMPRYSEGENNDIEGTETTR
jgi:hypothetical protein